MKSFPVKAQVLTAAAFSILFGVPAARGAQEAASPEAQAWIDIATFSGMGMPMGGMPMNPMMGQMGMVTFIHKML